MRLLTLILTILSAVFFTHFDLAFIDAQEGSPTPTQTPTSTSSPQINLEGCPYDELNKCIQFFQDKISELNQQSKTLASEIAVMDNQIKLTEARISATKQKIEELSSDIEITTEKLSTLQESLTQLTEVLLNRIIATYEVGHAQPFEILLSSNSASSFFSRLNYLRVAQIHDKKLIYITQAARNDYQNQKEIFENKKKKVEELKIQLEAYIAQLAEEQKNKENLLKVTKNDEARYQRLLAQAKAEQAIVFGGGEETFMRNVSKGDSIGFIASYSISPGCSSGAHLHFEVHKNGSVQDPNAYLRPANYSYSYSSDEYGYYGSINPSGDLQWPIDEPIKVNQGYGGSHTYAQRFYPNGIHMGIDMDSGSSSTVKSVKDGRLYAGSYSCSSGKLLYAKIEHDDGLVTWYLHMVPN